MTLVLRRRGTGNWSPVLITYSADRQGNMPTLIEAKVGKEIVLFGVRYRVSRVLP